jgi:UDP-N-acetylglucosamine:LPS N-acetylglucosamine transferase
MRMRPAFEGSAVTYVSTLEGYRSQVAPAPFHSIRDASLWNKLALLVQAMQMFWLLVRLRPDVVITTGAAPGYFAVRMGRWFGARTVWVDSMANVDELSLAGQKAGQCVDLWLTQWPHLARQDGPYCVGAVL